MEVHSIGTALVLTDNLPEEVVEMLPQDMKTDFIRFLGFQVVFIFYVHHVFLFGQT